MARRIFVVEDDEAVRDSLQVLLEAARFTTVGFATGDEFLRVHGAIPCDCVILDLNLPGKNGFDVLAELSASRARVPVIVVTGEALAYDAKDAVLRRAFAFLAKPVEGNELLATVDRAMAG